MEKIELYKIKQIFNKIPKSLRYLIFLIISILFVFEFVIFPPLSAQIEHGSFTYQTDFENLFDSMSKQIIKEDKYQEYPVTAIKEIRHNPDRYIDKKVAVTGELETQFLGYNPVPRLVDRDYIIYFDRKLDLKPKLNVKGLHVYPGAPFSVHDDIITVKGKIIYDEKESVLLVPHEVLYDGLTWEINY